MPSELQSLTGSLTSRSQQSGVKVVGAPPEAKRSYPRRSCGTAKVVRFEHAAHAAQAARVVLIIVLSSERRRKACPGGDGLCCQRRSRQCPGGCELREEGTAPLRSADLQGRRAADGQYANHTGEHVGERSELVLGHFSAGVILRTFPQPASMHVHGRTYCTVDVDVDVAWRSMYASSRCASLRSRSGGRPARRPGRVSWG